MIELNRLENQRRADEGQEERCAQDGQERVQVERLEFEGRGGRPEQGQQGGHEQQVERLEGERRHPRTPQARLCRSTWLSEHQDSHLAWRGLPCGLQRTDTAECVPATLLCLGRGTLPLSSTASSPASKEGTRSSASRRPTWSVSPNHKTNHSLRIRPTEGRVICWSAPHEGTTGRCPSTTSRPCWSPC